MYSLHLPVLRPCLDAFFEIVSEPKSTQPSVLAAGSKHSPAKRGGHTWVPLSVTQTGCTQTCIWIASRGNRSEQFPRGQAALQRRAGQGRAGLYLIILHTLQGQLVAVHPQRVPQDRDAVALLQLERLKPDRKRDGASRDWVICFAGWDGLGMQFWRPHCKGCFSS